MRGLCMAEGGSRNSHHDRPAQSRASGCLPCHIVQRLDGTSALVQQGQGGDRNRLDSGERQENRLYDINPEKVETIVDLALQSTERFARLVIKACCRLHVLVQFHVKCSGIGTLRWRPCTGVMVERVREFTSEAQHRLLQGPPKGFGS